MIAEVQPEGKGGAMCQRVLSPIRTLSRRGENWVRVLVFCKDAKHCADCYDKMYPLSLSGPDRILDSTGRLLNPD